MSTALLAAFLWWFGLVLMISPVVLFVWETNMGEGAEEADVIQWLMGKPLEFHEQCRMMMMSGVGMLGMAVVLGAVR